MTTPMSKPVYTYTHQEMRQAIIKAFMDGYEYSGENDLDEAALDEVEKIMSQIPEDEE